MLSWCGQPKPTYQSLAGYDMEVFYKDKWQSSRGANRSFSIVFADTKADAERCKLYDPEEDMILTYENPDVRPPHVSIAPTGRPYRKGSKRERVASAMSCR